MGLFTFSDGEHQRKSNVAIAIAVSERSFKARQEPNIRHRSVAISWHISALHSVTKYAGKIESPSKQKSDGKIFPTFDKFLAYFTVYRI